MAPAARFMVECAGLEVVTEPTESPDRVAAGIGIAGRALATAHALAFPYAFLWTHGNDDETDKDLMNGYGFHGATVAGRRVFGVDEIATTGDSLCTLVEMVQEAGGELECAAVLVDRSKGLAAEALGELGVRLNIVFEFDEEAGLIVPAGVNA